MLSKRLINSNDAAAGGSCTTNTNDYPTTNVAYYKMSTAADEKDTYNGAATDVNFNVQGKFGNAAEFNGSSSLISLPTGVDRNNNFTLSFWVNFDTLSDYDSLITLQINYRVYVNAMANGSLDFKGGNTTLSTNAGVVTTGNWYNIVCTKSSTLVGGKATIIYVNGVEVASNNNTSNADGASDTGLNLLGAYNANAAGGNFFYLDGKLDQVRIFSSALDATQVASLYNEVYCVPTIVPTDHFTPVLYTGNGGTQAITNVGFQPDFTWIKSRNAVGSHIATDSVRGNGKEIYLDLTNAQGTVNRISLTSTGFDVVSAGYPNQTNNTFVAWNWKSGGAAVSNPNGTLTSTISANVDAGFSIVKYTGNGNNSTIGHGLSVAPDLIITKGIDSVVGNTNWLVYNSISGATGRMFLNLSLGFTIGSTAYNDTEPTSSVFTIGTTGDINGNGAAYIAYCFHSVAGYSKIGSYTGTGATGNTIVTGFRPAFVMIKQTSSIGADNHWNMWDNKRVEEDMLRANTNSSEFAGPGRIDFLSNGFEMLDSDTSRNTSGGTYIFMAFAEEALPIVTRNATNPFGDSSELALYKFEDNANDAEGNYNGTASNVTYASGYIDKAAVFNGLQTSSASYIDISSATTTPVSSISFWFKTTVKNSTNANILAAGGSSSTRTGFSIRRNSSGFLNVEFTKGTPGSTQTVTGNQDITDGVWHNFILSMASDNTFVVYLDGQSHISGTRTHFTNGQSRSQSINRFGSDSVAIGANAFGGSIDQVRIFNRALDSGEVDALYNE